MKDRKRKAFRTRLEMVPVVDSHAGCSGWVWWSYSGWRTVARYWKALKKSDASGAQYLAFGSRMLKYSADGVSCVDGKKGRDGLELRSACRSPIADICENSAVVADQQGTSVYIFDENGQKGQFEALLPIE